MESMGSRQHREPGYKARFTWYIKFQPPALPPSAERAQNVRLHCRGKRVCAICAMAVDEVLDAGTVNEAVFCDFLERNLLPQ